MRARWRAWPGSAVGDVYRRDSNRPQGRRSGAAPEGHRRTVELALQLREWRERRRQSTPGAATPAYVPTGRDRNHRHLRGRDPRLLDTATALQRQFVPGYTTRFDLLFRRPGYYGGACSVLCGDAPQRDALRGAGGEPPALPRMADTGARTPGQHRREHSRAARAVSPLRTLASTDHKRIAGSACAVAFLFFLAGGLLALFMRSQLAADGGVVSQQTPTTNCSRCTVRRWSTCSIVPVALAVGHVFRAAAGRSGGDRGATGRARRLVDVRVRGRPMWSGFLTSSGAASASWWGFDPLSDSIHSPGSGMELWIFGVMLATPGRSCGRGASC